jgi:hypothetical protein
MIYQFVKNGEACIQLPLPVAHNKLPFRLSQGDLWLI